MSPTPFSSSRSDLRARGGDPRPRGGPPAPGVVRRGHKRPRRQDRLHGPPLRDREGRRTPRPLPAVRVRQARPRRPHLRRPERPPAGRRAGAARAPGGGAAREGGAFAVQQRRRGGRQQRGRGQLRRRRVGVFHFSWWGGLVVSGVVAVLLYRWENLMHWSSLFRLSKRRRYKKY